MAPAMAEMASDVMPAAVRWRPLLWAAIDFGCDIIKYGKSMWSLCTSFFGTLQALIEKIFILSW